MKKIAIFLATIIILCIPTTVFASADERILTNQVYFTIDGTTAQCYVYVTSDSPDTLVEVNLLDGSKCIGSWSAHHKGPITIDKSVTVRRGRTYTMTVDITVDDVAKPQIRREKRS